MPFFDTAVLLLMTAPPAAHRGYIHQIAARERLLSPSRSRLAAIMVHDVLNSIIAGGQISKYRTDVKSCAPGMKSGINSMDY